MYVAMPVIEECSASECAYNVENLCHARAITVGSSNHPACDTYIAADKPAMHHVHQRGQSAGVGACKVSKCRHNTDLECEAPSIVVRKHSAHADCVTYEARTGYATSSRSTAAGGVTRGYGASGFEERASSTETLKEEEVVELSGESVLDESDFEQLSADERRYEQVPYVESGYAQVGFSGEEEEEEEEEEREESR